jgi:hypothetical protein
MPGAADEDDATGAVPVGRVSVDRTAPRDVPLSDVSAPVRSSSSASKATSLLVPFAAPDVTMAGPSDGDPTAAETANGNT